MYIVDSNIPFYGWIVFSIQPQPLYHPSDKGGQHLLIVHSLLCLHVQEINSQYQNYNSTTPANHELGLNSTSWIQFPHGDFNSFSFGWDVDLTKYQAPSFTTSFSTTVLLKVSI